MSRVSGPSETTGSELRALTKPVPCPWCASPATVALLETLDDGYDVAVTGGPVVHFACRNPSHAPSRQQVLRMWADDRLSDYAGEPRSGARTPPRLRIDRP